jgi:hypothetical protein
VYDETVAFNRQVKHWLLGSLGIQVVLDFILVGAQLETKLGQSGF